MACPLCGDRCTCSFAPGALRPRASAPSSLTYEYDPEFQVDPDLDSNGSVIPSDDAAVPTQFSARVIASDDAAVSTPGFGALAASESRDPHFSDSHWPSDHPPAPPEDLTLESARAADNEPGPLWKQEVASRLESYRSRRGTRRPRFNGSLSLDFERATNRLMAVAEEPAWEPIAVRSARAEEATPDAANEFFGAAAGFPVPDSGSPVETADPAGELRTGKRYQRFEGPDCVPASAPRPAPSDQRPETNLIEFPRLPTLFDNAPTGNELAEAVVDKPRILYVPEEVPTAQAPLANIHLDPEELPAVHEVELPLRVAPMGHRVLAALTDALIVLAATAIFLALVLRQVPAPENKLGYALVAALPAVLWSIYEYLFLVHCAATPGMQMAHLSLASFDCEPIGRRARRARALAWILSSFSLGLGIIWALLDEDTLCWHDRITRTYLILPIPDYER